VWVVLAAAVLVVALDRMRSLITMLVVAMFFGIAMEPAVTWLHTRRGWRRGSATGLVFTVLGVGVVLLFLVLIPGLVTAADLIRDKVPEWIDSLNDQLNLSISTAESTATAAEVNEQVTSWLREHGTDLLGLAGNAVGLIFQGFTLAMFTFYFAADAPKIRHAVLRRLPPAKQQRLGWAWDTAIEQTGGYFYSRMLLVLINGGLFFFAMLLVGMPWSLALPLAAFEGFVAEFIPSVGTYIGAAVPIVVTLGVQGFVPALILTIWTIIYQQLENYVLSPRLSARTMEINGGVAFGAAMAGGALAGAMGAFMALPIAALITSFTKHYARSYPVTYHSKYDDVEATPEETASDGEQQEDADE
jgi:predicted PurR-regulated permease PerM